MIKRCLLFCSIVCFICLISCQNEQQNTKDRPHSPWMIRSVLDEQPRMLTLALHEKLWAAYSVENGALYKTWKGLVNWEGAVYNTIHGPQPTTAGDAYFINEYKNPWIFTDAQSEPSGRVPKYSYKGHKVVQGNAVLMYELSLDNTTVSVEEEVDAYESEQGQIVFSRKYRTTGVPENMSVDLHTNVSSIIIEQNINTNGELKVFNKKNRSAGKAEVLDLTGHLRLNSNGETVFDITLVDNALIPNENNPSGIDEEEEDQYEGARLIAQNDCKTCHNKKVKTIGPSYVSVAKKYKTNDDNINMLVSKVKNGGSGVWGNQIMNAHPDLPESDIKTMVEYVLSLDKDEETDEEETTGEEVTYWNAAKNIKEDDLVPGSVVSIYSLSGGVPKIPSVIGKKPIMAGIMSKFDNITGDDWKELNDYFVLNSIGYLKVDERGEYTFRVWSDDGSRVSINDKVILDNDGNHGVEYKEMTIGMEEGYYPFFIEFFQGVGGKFLSWNWKKPGDLKFEVIPEGNYFHKKEQQSIIGNLSLPMSSVSKIPGNQSALIDVHPSFDLTQSRPEGFTPKVGGMDFLDDGRLVVSCWDANGSVFVLDGVQRGDPSKITTTKIADGLAEPLGVKVVDGDIYVLQKQELTKLVDTNGDNIIDEYHTVCDDWGVSANFHEFCFGLEYKDGFFYAALATGIQPGGAGVVDQPKDRGHIIKISKDKGTYELFAKGLRTPNGVGIGHNNEIFVSDNQGDWLPSSKIMHVQKGKFFGSRAVDFEGTEGLVETKPVVWLPQDEIGNSPSTPSYLNLGPYKNQMIHGEVTNGGVKRVFVEEVDGKLQGCVFRFIQGLEAGINRLTWGPDGALYVGGIGSTGNWQQSNKLWYGLQRLAYNEKTTFEMLAVRAKSNGVEIEFTEPLNEGDGWSANDFLVRQWYYEPTAAYGGPKLDNKTLNISRTSVSEDRKKVFLQLDGMKEDHVIYVNINNPFYSVNGNSLWSTEAWYTMNSIPKEDPGLVRSNPEPRTNNSLTQSEKDAGWELLFNGKDLSQWTNFNKTTLGKGWKVEDDHFTLYPKVEDGGDIVTKEEYENFELHLEWKISNCGNSGIMFNVVQDEKYCCPWLTGPEMQILDNSCHPDTRYVTHRAGDLYDMIETNPITVKSAGNWNKVRIKIKDGEANFYLNGYKVIEFKMFDDNWTEMIKNSKFKDMPDFGLSKKGHISLQDHSDIVSFRNIKIKRL